MEKSFSFYRDQTTRSSNSEDEIDDSRNEDESYTLLTKSRRDNQIAAVISDSDSDIQDVTNYQSSQIESSSVYDLTTSDITFDDQDISIVSKLDGCDTNYKDDDSINESIIGRRGPRACKRFVVESDSDSDCSEVTQTKVPPFKVKADSSHRRISQNYQKLKLSDSIVDAMAGYESDCSEVMDIKVPYFERKSDTSRLRVSQNFHAVKTNHKAINIVENVLTGDNSDSAEVTETNVPQKKAEFSILGVSGNYFPEKREKKTEKSLENVLTDDDSDSSNGIDTKETSLEQQVNFTPAIVSQNFLQIRREEKRVESLENVLPENESDCPKVMESKETCFGVSQNVFPVESMENAGESLENFQTENKSEHTSDIESIASEEIPDDDLVMSAATRMSIHGIRPKDMASDESDFIVSDSESETELKPNPYIDEPTVNVEDIKPILYEVKRNNSAISNDETILIEDNDADSSICIVEKEIPTIDLSHFDDDAFVPFNRSKKSSKVIKENDTMKKYLVPASYPNSRLVYVAQAVKDSEMNKLAGLREDLVKLKYLLDTLDLKSLPDRGAKLSSRLQVLEDEVKNQAERVSNLIVDSKNPTKEELLAYEAPKPSSWEDQAAAINQVQPTHYGDKGMMNHLAERTTILERLRDLHASLASRPGEKEHATQPRAVRAPLMPHQAHALAWLTWRETQRPRGGILADDMGLGKTLTMIALIVQAKEKDVMIQDDEWNDKENSKLVKGGTLVICPASLLSQWAGEVTARCQKHFLDVEVHHGPNRETMPHRLARRDLVVTTYNIVARDLDKGGVVMKISWSRVILDEAHVVRNHKSLTARAVFALKSRARWCLTGTPVQNKDLDVFALLKFLQCSPFDEIVMWKKWIDNKSAGGQERLSTLMRCLLLRRTKTQLQSAGALQSLPTKSIENIEVTLSREEMNVYQKVLVFSKTLFAQFLHQRAEKEADMAGGFLATSSKPNEAYNKMHSRMVALQGAKPVKSHEILVLLLRLRQLCCHAGLITAMLDPEEAAEGGVEEDPGSLDLLEELHKLTLTDNTKHNKSLDTENTQAEPGVGEDEGMSVNEALRSVLVPSNPVFNLQRSSAKITAILDCLKTKVFTKPGEKAVIVSQWTSVLSIIERTLSGKVAMATLSGKVPVSARGAIVKQFNDPNSKVRVLLLSLCAGGVGLNLIGGNHLLLVDLHWNPQLEAQAQDRIYRVGQSKPVHIYKFICMDTIEQSIKKLQDHKLEIAEGVLTGAKYNKSSKLSIEDLKVLFNMT